MICKYEYNRNQFVFTIIRLIWNHMNGISFGSKLIPVDLTRTRKDFWNIFRKIKRRLEERSCVSDKLGLVQEHNMNTT